MADSTSIPSTSNNASTVADSSCFGRTVCLYDWWLIKAENDFEGKWLAVSGITSRKEKAVRVFVSAPVVKRYDLFSLETADSIYIVIKGFINEQRTLENGFPPEVFNNFLFGFPTNWERFAVDWFRHESTNGIDLGNAVPENVSPIDPEVLSDGVEKSTPTLSKSLEEALTRGGVNGSHGGDSHRCTTRLHNKVFPQKKPASGVAQMCPNKEQNAALGPLENPGGEGLESRLAPIQLHSLGGQVNSPPKQLVKSFSSAIGPEVLSDGVEKSTSTLSKSSEEALETHKKSFPKEECHASKETTGKIDVAHGRGSKRNSTRLHSIEVCKQKKPASEGSQKNLDKEQHSSSGALENPDGEGLESPMTPIQLQSLGGQVNTLPKQLVKNYSSAIGPEVLFDEKSIPTSKSPEEALETHKKSFPTEECHASKETTGKIDVAHGRGSKRHSTKLHSIEVCKQKKSASEGSKKYLDKEQHSSSGALENPDGEGLESPMKPAESQSLSQVNTLSKKLVKNSASRVSRPFSANDECCLNKQKVTVETKAIMPKRKRAGSAFANKYPQKRDADSLIKGGKEKIYSVSPLSSSMRKSRSGRLLLPPLEFWRNQIPIYDADHEIVEIQEGASVISPIKGSSPSLSRSNKKKRAA